MVTMGTYESMTHAEQYAAERLSVMGAYMPADHWVQFLLELAGMGRYDTLLQYLYLARKHHVLHLLTYTADNCKRNMIREKETLAVIFSFEDHKKKKSGKRRRSMRPIV